MNQVVSTISAFMILSLLVPASADEVTLEKALEVTTLAQAQSLAPETTSVYIKYTSEMNRADEFTRIMSTLARNPGIRHLTLYIPNSNHVKDQELDVLREFKSLETLKLTDARDWKAPSVFEQVAGIKGLTEVKLSFM